MEITLASIDDINSIQKLAADTWPIAYNSILSDEQLKYMLGKFYSVEALKDQILTKGHQFFVLKKNNKDKIGFASVSKENDSTFKLQKLYILPIEQGKKSGSMLLNKIISFCQQNQGKRLILNVNRYNKARYFYEKYGFKIIEEVDIPIGNNFYMNDYVMKLNL